MPGRDLRKPAKRAGKRTLPVQKIVENSSGAFPEALDDNSKSRTNIGSKNKTNNIEIASSELNTDAASKQAPKLFRISSESLRRTTIVIISASLLFGVGVQLGSNRGSSNVDQAISTILDSSAKEIDRAVLERAAIEGALKASGDEWANYFPKSALDVLEEQNSNMFTGIGVWLNRTRGGQVKIASIQENSPAANAGLSVGDQLLEVNDTDVRGASLTSVVALIRGDIGKKVELLVNRDDKQILVALSNEKVALSTVEANQVSNSVALIEVASFSRGTSQEVEEALAKLNFKSGIILDLRNNPGGLLEEAVRVAQLFIGNGVIVSYQVNGAEKIYKAVNPKPILVPVVVLINRNTASSAEIVASAFQDRNRGVVLGERSYGKGSVQEFVTLEDGSKLELTVALYVTPSGKIIDEVGVTPDLQVSSREISIKALQVLGGLASFNSKKSS